MATPYRFAANPGLELFLALAAVLDRTASEPRNPDTARWLAQARRRLDRNFLRRAGEIPGGAAYWLRLAAEIPFTVDGDVDTVIASVEASPAELAEAAADLLRRFIRMSFAAFWRMQAPLSVARIAMLQNHFGDTEGPLVAKALQVIGWPDAGAGAVVLVPTAFPEQAADCRARIAGTPGSVVLPFDIGIDPAQDREPFQSVDPPRISTDPASVRDAALVFRALGDKTRYAIAGLVAREALTGAELARRLGVARPTMTHHLHQLRAAGLLIEERRGNSIALRLNRAAIAAISAATEAQFYDAVGAVAIHRSRRRG